MIGGYIMDKETMDFAQKVNRTYADTEQHSIAYNLDQRYHRPSAARPYNNPYSFEDFKKLNDAPPLMTTVFDKPEDVVLAFFGITRDAANMLGYSGTCGTVGDSILPYPYAYELFTKELQAQATLEEFINSARGIGHATLLKLMPANKNYFMFEVELIRGIEKSNQDYSGGSRFAYDYGLIGVEETPEAGWKINYYQYIFEDFLCAPYHGWFYNAEQVVSIVYKNLNIIEQIDSTDNTKDMTFIYASGYGRRYRFDFVRLTNGYDILLHENIYRNGDWADISLLDNEWRYLKLEKV